MNCVDESEWILNFLLVLLLNENDICSVYDHFTPTVWIIIRQSVYSPLVSFHGVQYLKDRMHTFEYLQN